MPIPPRSELPADYVELLEIWDGHWEADYGRAAILPADKTPELLVTMAKRLDKALTTYSHTAAASMIEPIYRECIDATLARKTTQPVSKERLHLHPHIYQGVDLQDHPELMYAFMEFEDRIKGENHADSDSMERYRSATIRRKRLKAQDFGLDLDLTDEEWLQL